VKDILPEVVDWTGRGERVAIGMVVGVSRSAPRPLGAKMAVSESGLIIGAVSGGCVEGAVVEIAERILRDRSGPEMHHFGIADDEAWEVGLPCGGEIDVWVEEFEPRPFLDVAVAGGRAAEVTLLEGDGAGTKLLVDPDGTTHGTLGSPELDAQAREAAAEHVWTEYSAREGALFVDVVHPAPRLIVFGAVDFAAAVCSIAKASGWRPFVVDPRARFATPERFPDAERVLAAWPEKALAELGGIDPATSIAVLTHDPKLDDAALLIALRSEANYVGAMGSRRAQDARRERLLEAGMTDAELERLSAPIGLDLGATSNEETALSIVAEVVAARHEREGGRLKHRKGSIHALPAPQPA
jgi:xanthine dehydrogenase accessory factor